MELDDKSCPISEDVIVQALEVARKRASSAEQERSELDREIAAAREEQRLLEKLLALRRNGLAETSANLGVVQADESAVPTLRPGESLLQAVIEELLAASRPLHISELMRILRNRNVEIPGSGTQANLITYLRRDERFVRPSRGMYALATSGLQNMETPRRKRHRRIRMRSTKSQERNNQ